jgi:hypothetical protein
MILYVKDVIIPASDRKGTVRVLVRSKGGFRVEDYY